MPGRCVNTPALTDHRIRTFAVSPLSATADSAAIIANPLQRSFAARPQTPLYYTSLQASSPLDTGLCRRLNTDFDNTDNDVMPTGKFYASIGSGPAGERSAMLRNRPASRTRVPEGLRAG